LAALTAKVEHALLKFANTPEEILSLGHLPTAWVTAAQMDLGETSFS
jgi:hypothetical protein